MTYWNSSSHFDAGFICLICRVKQQNFITLIDCCSKQSMSHKFIYANKQNWKLWGLQGFEWIEKHTCEHCCSKCFCLATADSDIGLRVNIQTMLFFHQLCQTVTNTLHMPGSTKKGFCCKIICNKNKQFVKCSFFLSLLCMRKNKPRMVKQRH